MALLASRYMERRKKGRKVRIHYLTARDRSKEGKEGKEEERKGGPNKVCRISKISPNLFTFQVLFSIKLCTYVASIYPS